MTPCITRTELNALEQCDFEPSASIALIPLEAIARNLGPRAFGAALMIMSVFSLLIRVRRCDAPVRGPPTLGPRAGEI